MPETPPPEALEEADEVLEDDEPTEALLLAVDRAELVGDTIELAIPATEDLERVEEGWPVLVYAFDPGRREPKVTWRATFAGAGDVERVEVEPHVDPELGDEPDPDPDDDGAVGIVRVRLRDVGPLPEREWISTNELVPKQERRARFYMPREPRVVRLPL